MTPFLLILFCVASVTAAVFYFLKQKAEKTALAERARADAAVAHARQEIEQKTVELNADAERIRLHYETESRRIIEAIHADLENARAKLERFRDFGSLQQSEEEVRATLVAAIAEATALRAEAEAFIKESRLAATDELKEGQRRAQEIHRQAEALLAQTTRDAARIVTDAEGHARQIGGDAYAALRDKQMLDQAVTAIHNVIEGYGDRYIIPTHSLLDDLASDFGHTAAGEALRTAREQTRQMVFEGLAATCDYSEKNRRETAIRFVTDAFNGRVDAILSRVKHDNYGTLEQEILDGFSLVNLNGEAFRNARVLRAYCDARVAELRWAVVVQELKLKEREQQRRIQEQIREEEKARREYERAMQEAVKEEQNILRAMEKAREEVAHANAQDRAKFEAQLAELGQRLVEAEAKNQRALSMAQQTRSGHVYIISNIGSFGDDVLKIGMTRRLEPDDRIKELGDASVPFEFDVHAMIRCDDAPKLERELHTRFDDARVNKVNYRKEFFRVPIHQLREFFAERKLEATFTMTAEAREYRETKALERMPVEERQSYRLLEDFGG